MARYLLQRDLLSSLMWKTQTDSQYMYVDYINKIIIQCFFFLFSVGLSFLKVWCDSMAALGVTPLVLQAR